jgi:protein gp37
MTTGSKIEWCDHTFNPWWGCARVSPACRFYYAERDARRYGHQVWRRHGPRRLLSDGNWRLPLRWNRDAQRAGVPALVFCASMADVFEDHPQVVEPRQRLWRLIEDTPHLRWLLLTKRPENVPEMVPGSWATGWPEQVWLGTSVEGQRYARLRIPLLLDVQGVRVRFLSCEPLLGPLDLSAWLSPRAVDWVIAGGESGPRARPMHPDWARTLRNQAAAADVPFLLKLLCTKRSVRQLTLSPSPTTPRDCLVVCAPQASCTPAARTLLVGLGVAGSMLAGGSLELINGVFCAAPPPIGEHRDHYDNHKDASVHGQGPAQQGKHHQGKSDEEVGQQQPSAASGSRPVAVRLMLGLRHGIPPGIRHLAMGAVARADGAVPHRDGRLGRNRLSIGITVARWAGTPPVAVPEWWGWRAA